VARLRLSVLAPLAALAAAVAAPAAQADLVGGLVGTVVSVVQPTCGTPEQPFAAVDGDTRSYYAVPNNGLESGSTGWTLSRGARVVPGNEPWYASGPGRYSLLLPPGSSALSPTACIGALDPTLRYFAVSNDANRGLNVQIVFRGAAGNLLGVLDFDTLSPDGYDSWQPSDDVPSLLGGVPLLTRSFQVRFTPLQWSGSWQIDDLYVDPWISAAG
jgi:hypothetical protein